jgi:hypothetical protein
MLIRRIINWADLLLFERCLTPSHPSISNSSVPTVCLERENSSNFLFSRHFINASGTSMPDCNHSTTQQQRSLSTMPTSSTASSSARTFQSRSTSSPTLRISDSSSTIQFRPTILLQPSDSSTSLPIYAGTSACLSRVRADQSSRGKYGTRSYSTTLSNSASTRNKSLRQIVLRKIFVGLVNAVRNV